MKNFPHQFNQIDKLTNALRVLSNLLEADDEAWTDGVYGPALARAGVINIKGTGSIDARLREEAKKVASNRGSHTASRDLHRLLNLTGFIAIDRKAGYCEITSRGRDLLAAQNEQVIHGLWRKAMLDMDLDGSHPYRIMLRLIADNPGIDKSKLLLALVAVDDSEAEYERINGFVDQTMPEILRNLGLGKFAAANAVKILPAIATQTGEIEVQRAQCFLIEAEVGAEDGIETKKRKTKAKRTTPRMPSSAREVSADEIASDPEFSDPKDASVDLTEAIEARNRRTLEHQSLVRSLASLLANEGFKLFENPFDCLAVRGNQVLMIEVKTLDGSPTDERKQAERAFGQLRGYRHFDTPNNLRNSRIAEFIAFSHLPTQQTVSFLNKNGFTVLWPHGIVWEYSNVRGQTGVFHNL